MPRSGEQIVKKALGRHATVSVVKDGEVKQTRGKLRKFDGEPAVVRVSMGATKNMGNYESLRLGVDLALPCSPAEVDVAFDRAAKFVEAKLNTLIQEISPGDSVSKVDINDVEL
jgi:hypothetical protein